MADYEPEVVTGAGEAGLATVRRIEAVSFRSFPASSVLYDRTWALRLTAGHPAKRLNSLNPLDPRDDVDLEARLAVACSRFEAYGLTPTLRQTPLTPPALVAMLDAAGWSRIEESLVMTGLIDQALLREAVDRVPLKDVGRWVDRHLRISGEPVSRRAGLVEVVSAIQAPTGLFLSETRGSVPIAAVRCVREGDLAGIFELETNPRFRRKGHGRAIVLSALKWAHAGGAADAWLQVVADNEAAVSLYGQLGMRTRYRYCYRRPPECS